MENINLEPIVLTKSKSLLNVIIFDYEIETDEENLKSYIKVKLNNKLLGSIQLDPTRTHNKYIFNSVSTLINDTSMVDKTVNDLKLKIEKEIYRIVNLIKNWHDE